MAASKPLMLKDFLALDDVNYSDDSSNAFQCIPRRRSRTVLAKISAAINAVKSGPTSSPDGSFLPRSLSRRLLGRGFWRRAAKEEAEAVRVKDIVRLNSFEMYSQRTSLYFPSPAPSSRSNSFSIGESMYSLLHSPSEKMDGAASAEFTCNHQKATEEPKKKKSECRDCQAEEEKEQLSPVSVMNFPFQEDDEDCNDNGEATSPCFEQSLANIERTKYQLLQKIRRFESLVELDPLDLLESFTNFKDYTSSNDYEEEEEEEEEEEVTGSSLIRRLRSVGPHKDLLVDFFDEGLTWSNNVEELLISAKKWIEGEETLISGDHEKDQIKDMEKNGRWRYFGGDKEDLVADMEIRMLGSLIEELVLDLVS